MKFRLSLLALSVLALLSTHLATAQLPGFPAALESQAGSQTPCNMDSGSAPLPALEASYLANPVGAGHKASAKVKPADAKTVGYQYLLTFYARWYTYYQGAFGPCNKLVGPDKVTWIYHVVVAIQVDTLYASAFIGAKTEPVIVTVQATTDNYSVLNLDQYGNVFPGIPSNQPGTYGLTAPGWQGTLPPGVKQVPIPNPYTELIFRADKYVKGQNGQYVDMTMEADKFRRGLHAAGLTDYLNDPNSGATTIAHELLFAFPFKGTAVDLLANDPVIFLTMLQTAVMSPTTKPLSPVEQSLSATFNSLFSDKTNWPDLSAGAQMAHDDVDANYLTHTFQDTFWVEFTNIGAWNKTAFPQYLDQDSVTDYIQYGNNHDAAVYYHTFRDSNGDPLDGGNGQNQYVLQFPSGQQPDVTRFWSLHAYLPVGIELVPNSADKYNVAAYTPGLVTNSDGSVTVLMSRDLPNGFPEANWLPIPKDGNFSIMLRAYGPQGSVLNNTYVPPPIVKQARSH